MSLGRRFPLSLFFVALAGSAVYACSAVGDGSEFTGAGGAGGGAASTGHGGASAQMASSSADGLFDAGPAGSTGSGGPGCAAATQYVYTLDAQANLYKFDPPSLKFTLIGKLNCPQNPNFPAGPYSMAVDRNANAWVVFTDGHLFQVDTKTAACTSTLFKPNLNSFTTFGMGFASNSPGSADETLYVADSGGGSPQNTQGLAKIDLMTMTLIPLGKYDQENGRAELTGTGDAKLYGAFENSPYTVDEINKTNGKILSKVSQFGINALPNSSNFAFAFWGGRFYLFVGPGTSTDVWLYDPGKVPMDGGVNANPKDIVMNVTMGGSPIAIVGAGVSTCAPTKPPS